ERALEARVEGLEVVLVHVSDALAVEPLGLAEEARRLATLGRARIDRAPAAPRVRIAIDVPEGSRRRPLLGGRRLRLPAAAHDDGEHRGECSGGASGARSPPGGSEGPRSAERRQGPRAYYPRAPIRSAFRRHARSTHRAAGSLG